VTRYLGIDYGTRRVGVALSDDEGRFAQALLTIDRKTGEDAVKRIGDLVREHDVGSIVLGMPLDRMGEEGPAAKRVRAFGEALGAETGLAVHFEDERFSTKAAATALDHGRVRGKERREVIDETTATLILQGHLDRIHARSWSAGSDEADAIAATQADLDPGRESTRRGRGRTGR
jgi:putative Holliday junction resolvase